MGSSKQVDKTNKNMEATALIGCKEWRENGQLKEYFDKQITAIKERHIKITRIFLLDKDQIKDEFTLNTMKMHANEGIEVRYAEKEELSENLPPELLTKAFVIYDDKVAFIGDVSPLNSKRIIKGIKTIDQKRISKLKDMFNELKINHSKHFTVTPSTPAPTTPEPTQTTPVPTETTSAPTQTTPIPTETTPVPTSNISGFKNCNPYCK